MSPSSSLAEAVRWPATPLMGPPRVSVLLGRACPLPVAVCLSLPSAHLSPCFPASLSLQSLFLSASVSLPVLCLPQSPFSSQLIDSGAGGGRGEAVTGLRPQHPGDPVIPCPLPTRGSVLIYRKRLPDSCAQPGPCLAQQHKKIKELQMAPSLPGHKSQF